MSRKNCGGIERNEAGDDMFPYILKLGVDVGS